MRELPPLGGRFFVIERGSGGGKREWGSFSREKRRKEKGHQRRGLQLPEQTFFAKERHKKGDCPPRRAIHQEPANRREKKFNSIG